MTDDLVSWQAVIARAREVLFTPEQVAAAVAEGEPIGGVQHPSIAPPSGEPTLKAVLTQLITAMLPPTAYHDDRDPGWWWTTPAGRWHIELQLSQHELEFANGRPTGRRLLCWRLRLDGSTTANLPGTPESVDALRVMLTAVGALP